MQTSWATCSPAVAATLFRGEAITVSEAEMIPLCLTDYAGTSTLGLYRIASRHDFSDPLHHGGIPGMGHSVVVLGPTDDGDFIVGAPTAGSEIWSKADLDLLWQGVGIRICKSRCQELPDADECLVGPRFAPLRHVDSLAATSKKQCHTLAHLIKLPMAPRPTSNRGVPTTTTLCPPIRPGSGTCFGSSVSPARTAFTLGDR